MQGVTYVIFVCPVLPTHCHSSILCGFDTAIFASLYIRIWIRFEYLFVCIFCCNTVSYNILLLVSFFLIFLNKLAKHSSLCYASACAQITVLPCYNPLSKHTIRKPIFSKINMFSPNPYIQCSAFKGMLLWLKSLSGCHTHCYIHQGPSQLGLTIISTLELLCKG